MIDGAASIFHALLDWLKVLGLMLMGMVMWKGNTAHAEVDHEQITNGLKHVGDAAGIGAVIVAWLDIINPVMETGIIGLTFVWMIYRILEMRVNIKAKQKASDDKD